MWVDLEVENHLKDTLTPRALPSAVLLNPHKRPRFVTASHWEKEGEPLPIKRDNVIELVETVLSGSAQFTQLPAGALAQWADRGTASGQNRADSTVSAIAEKPASQDIRRRRSVKGVQQNQKADEQG